MDIKTACDLIDDIRSTTTGADQAALTALVRDLWDASTGRCDFAAGDWTGIVLGNYAAETQVRAILSRLAA